jgi:hypothetical protein
VAVNGAAPADFELADGASATVSMCGSAVWDDGVLVSSPMGAASSSSPLFFSSGRDDDPSSGLPRAALVADLSGQSSEVSMDLHQIQDQLGGSAWVHLGGVFAEDNAEFITSEYWSTGPAVSGAAKCAGAGGGDVLSGGPVALPGGAVGALCYQLRISAVATRIVKVRAFTVFGLFEAWGGAFGFVFGVFGLAFFWLEHLWVSYACCCPRLCGRRRVGEDDRKQSSGAGRRTGSAI